MKKIVVRRLLPTVALLTLLLPSVSTGKPGVENPPVAMRFWYQGMISIETWWDLTVVIDPYVERLGLEDTVYQGSNLTADLVLVTREHLEYNKGDSLKGNPTIMQGLDAKGEARERWGVLDRLPNAESPTWLEGSIEQPGPKSFSPHAIKVETITVWRDDLTGSSGDRMAIFVIEVNGVRIAHLGEFWPAQLTENQLESLGRIDVLCAPRERDGPRKSERAIAIIEQIDPRFLITLDYKRKRHIESGPIDEAIGKRYRKAMIRDGNTFAVSTAEPQDDRSTVHVIPKYKPWQPNGELADLMKKMDDSCRAAQQVFAPLSARQMNWSPPNGTHTPRWNTEHMMGRQLGFFSQIFAVVEHQHFSEIDPKWSMMSAIDLNPKQMPVDYQPAHPDWDGAEEARQMQRANAYVHRFAYLLGEIDLDEQAPGSRWSLRGLLKQMEKHFAEHTANVKKKFELEGWPDK